MMTNLLNARDDLRRTTLCLVLLCASVAACHADASAQAAANLKKPLAQSGHVNASAPAAASPEKPPLESVNVDANSLLGMEPVQPFDEKMVTPMETVGAPAKD